MPKNKSLRTCANGHHYHKSSSCPVCPVCESEKDDSGSFLNLLAAPARRALENQGIRSLEKLSEFSEREILDLHGMGPASIPRLKKILKENGMQFRKS